MANCCSPPPSQTERTLRTLSSEARAPPSGASAERTLKTSLLEEFAASLARDEDNTCCLAGARRHGRRAMIDAGTPE